MFTPDQLTLIRRAYADQAVALLKTDRPAIQGAFAIVPREKFLGPGPWSAFFPFTGYRKLNSNDPVVLYQDLVFGLDQRRGVNNGSPSLHAQMMDALDVNLGDHIVHIGCGSGYYSAILSELVGIEGKVTSVEYDEHLAGRAREALADRPNVHVICADGTKLPDCEADGIYVNFSVLRPSDCWIENLTPNGRLVFPLGAPNRQQSTFEGRHSERGAVIRVQRQEHEYNAKFIAGAFFVCTENLSDQNTSSEEKLRSAFRAGGIEQIRKLVWKQQPVEHSAWYADDVWALCYR